MVNLIVDYKQGREDRHQAFVASWTNDPAEAAKYILWTLRKAGCQPVFITTVAGNYTPEQLMEMATDPRKAQRFRLVWLDPVLMDEVARNLTPEERRIAAQVLKQKKS